MRLATLALLLATPAFAEDWRTPDPHNLMIMSLDSGDVVIELAPAFAPESVKNLRTLVNAGYFDGLAIIRSQDNYVVQWGDPDAGTESERSIGDASETVTAEFSRPFQGLEFSAIESRDAYADSVGFVDGFPTAHDGKQAWLTHCYAMVGVARGNDADSGNGTSLYVITGHAPRHLDRNITLIGRVLVGMEQLSVLPRGPGPMGFYEDRSTTTPILKVQMGNEVDKPPAIEVIDTNAAEFGKYVAERTTRSGEWFVEPVGRIELCNLHPAVREKSQ